VAGGALGFACHLVRLALHALRPVTHFLPPSRRISPRTTVNEHTEFGGA
jgi:hypothetical protein